MLIKKLWKCFCHSLIYTHINYGILSWSSASKTSLKPLKVILNRLIRRVTFTYHKKVTLSPLYKKVDLLQLSDIYNLELGKLPLYKKVDLLQLSDIYNLELGKLMFKYSKQMLPSNFSLFFKNLIPDRILTPNYTYKGFTLKKHKDH